MTNKVDIDKLDEKTKALMEDGAKILPLKIKIDLGNATIADPGAMGFGHER